MAQHPAMPLWTDAYLGDTMHLTTVQHGAYLLILITMWRAGGTLPEDDEFLARVTRQRLDHWRRMKPTIMAFMQPDGAGRFTQKRLKYTREKLLDIGIKRAQAVNGRWLKNKKEAYTNVDTNPVQNDSIQNHKKEERGEKAPKRPFSPSLSGEVSDEPSARRKVDNSARVREGPTDAEREGMRVSAALANSRLAQKKP